jgi:hypothetical protein
MVAHLTRDEFRDEHWDYRPGESAVWIAPTGGGKSFMMWQLIERALQQNPSLGLSAAMPKPADSTTEQWAQHLNLHITDRYPFKKKFWQDEPRGHVFWPKHIVTDADENHHHLSTSFKTMLNGEFWAGNRIVAVDDAYKIAAVLGANRECDTYLSEGRSNRAGLMGCLQQPRGTVSGGSPSGFWYSQPQHLFLGHDGVAANRERFGEIAMGIDPKLIDHIVANLRTYRINDSNVSDMLYLCRSGPYAAVVSPFLWARNPGGRTGATERRSRTRAAYAAARYPKGCTRLTKRAARSSSWAGQWKPCRRHGKTWRNIFRGSKLTSTLPLWQREKSA